MGPWRLPSWHYRFRRCLTEAATSLPEHLRARGDPAQPLPSVPHRVLEHWVLLFANGINTKDYYTLRLHRRKLPWRRKLEFAGSVSDVIWLRALNPDAYSVLCEDKLVFKRYMEQSGLPLARTFGVIGPHGRAEDGHPLQSPEQLRDWLRKAEIENIVLKPCRGFWALAFSSLAAHRGGSRVGATPERPGELR